MDYVHPQYSTMFIRQNLKADLRKIISDLENKVIQQQIKRKYKRLKLNFKKIFRNI